MEESKPAPNIFSKKRPIDEISKRVEQIQVNNSSDVEMEEQLPSAIKAADDSMATENFHSAIDDSKFQHEEVKESPIKPPTKTTTVEDDWVKLRTQNQILNPQA